MLENLAAIAILASAPTSPTDRTPSFDLGISDAEVVTGDRSSHLLTYDEDGEVSAEIVVWVEPSDRIHVDANFADGVYLNVTVDGEDINVDSANTPEVVERLQAIDDPWVLVTTYGMACSCLPLLIEEFEEIKCPGFG